MPHSKLLKARLLRFPPAAHVTVAPVTGGGSRLQASRVSEEEAQARSLLIALFLVETDTIASFLFFPRVDWRRGRRHKTGWPLIKEPGKDSVSLSSAQLSAKGSLMLSM